jgi:hypothetical protein
MPQLHRAAQMRQQMIEKARIRLLEGSFSVSSVQAHRHETGSPEGYNCADHMAQSNVSPQVSVELAADVFGIRHQMTTHPCSHRGIRVSLSNGLCRPDGPQVDVTIVGLIGGNLLVGVIGPVEEFRILALLV